MRFICRQNTAITNARNVPDLMQNKQILTADTVFARVSRWCAQQERSQFETRRKLTSMGVPTSDADQIVAGLISEGYLSEERFARAFAGGKFRMKAWGKNKIRAALQMHRVSPRTIAEALDQIDDEDYLRAISLAVQKKLKTLAFADRRARYHKTLAFAVGKGFERALVAEELNRILGEPTDEFRT